MDYQQSDSIQIFNTDDLPTTEGNIPHCIELIISEQREFHFFHFSVYNSYTLKNIDKKGSKYKQATFVKNEFTKSFMVFFSTLFNLDYYYTIIFLISTFYK